MIKKGRLILILIIISLFSISGIFAFSESWYSIPNTGKFAIETSQMPQVQVKNILASLNNNINVGNYQVAGDRILIEFRDKKNIRAIGVSDTGIKIEEFPNSYIIEFNSEPLIARQARLKQGNIVAAEAVQNYKSQILEEHQKAVGDITNRLAEASLMASPPSDNIFSRFFYNTILFFKKIFAVKALPSPVVKSEYYNTFNGLSIEMNGKDAAFVASSPYVKNIYINKKVQATMMDSVPLINADDVWSMQDSQGINFTGKNITIAIIDTGVDYTHPDLGGKYCGNNPGPGGGSGGNSNSSLSNNLILKLSFDEGTGATAYDSSGFGNNGIISGATWTSGIAGNALKFESNGYITSLFNQITGTQARTISAWIKAGSNNWTSAVALTDGACGAGRFRFDDNVGKVVFEVGNANLCAGQAASINSISSEEWKYVVGVYNGTDNILYVDGVLQSVASVSVIPLNSGPLIIGAGTPADWGIKSRFNGTIDEVKIWNKALNSSEILSEYNNIINPPAPQECKVVEGYDFVNNDADPMDDNGHGTHVSGTAAGSGNGGLKGVAPDSKILAYKVLNQDGSGTWESVIAGIERAVDPNQDGDFLDHADVISMSLGGWGDPDDPVSQAVDNAVNAGVVSVIAAGNSGPWESTIGSPGTARKALTVGATYKKDYEGTLFEDDNPKVDQITSFSSRGPVLWRGGALIKPDVVAPGALICSARYDSVDFTQHNPLYDLCLDDKHVNLAGTSMATPIVAGVAALVRQAHPELSAEEIKDLIKITSKDLKLDLNTQGAGRVDALEAVNSKILVPSLVDFGTIGGTTSLVKQLKIKNIGDNDINLALSLTSAVAIEDGVSINAITLNKNSLLIPAGGEAVVNVNLNLDINYDGFFYGKIIISNGRREYSVIYSFSRYSQLNLSMEGEHYPYFYVHDNSFNRLYGAGQWWDFIGNKVSLLVKSGDYTVYAINDFVNPDYPMWYPEIDEYILTDVVHVDSGSSVSKEFKLSDGKKFTIKARDLSGKELNLYEWVKGVMTYKNKFDFCRNYSYTSQSNCEQNSAELLCKWDEQYDWCYDRAFSSTFSDPLFGDRTIYLTNKANNGLENDVLLKYFGTPENGQ